MMDYQERIIRKLSTHEPQKMIGGPYEPPEEDVKESFPCGCVFDKILCTEALELKAEYRRLWASGNMAACQEALEVYHQHYEEQEERK